MHIGPHYYNGLEEPYMATEEIYLSHRVDGSHTPESSHHQKHHHLTIRSTIISPSEAPSSHHHLTIRSTIRSTIISPSEATRKVNGSNEAHQMTSGMGSHEN